MSIKTQANKLIGVSVKITDISEPRFFIKDSTDKIRRFIGRDETYQKNGEEKKCYNFYEFTQNKSEINISENRFDQKTIPDFYTKKRKYYDVNGYTDIKQVNGTYSSHEIEFQLFSSDIFKIMEVVLSEQEISKSGMPKRDVNGYYPFDSEEMVLELIKNKSFKIIDSGKISKKGNVIIDFEKGVDFSMAQPRTSVKSVNTQGKNDVAVDEIPF